MTPLLRLNREHQTKRFESGNNLFSFFASSLVARKTGNTGAETLSGRTYLLLDGVSPLYKLIEGNLMKSYGAAKAHRISTNNSNQAMSLEYVREHFSCSLRS
jgi:hypothetical protein